jgi:hypothetical protein
MKSRKFAVAVVALVLSLPPGFAASVGHDPTGIWKWTTTGRNGQSEETVLRVSLAKDGMLAGTITDRAGTRAVSSVSLKGNRVEIADIRDTPGGRLETTYAVELEGENPRVMIERPDRSPGGVAARKMRRTEVAAKRMIEPPVNKGNPPGKN